ncbi:GATOR complex protein NPRL3 isoform X2 [Camponotus floridanus]|uniref:GATOR complex protein NPRL3 isoform X2 n=1 Tax=Camponotus floridanus TaxID=104421 RepID=UPI00059C7B1E|nr:GATOR complex protein NPRL3 isoform X2 [Camponotus floridanus]
MEIHPLSIILVKSDSKGDRLLFRYPHMTNHVRDSSQYTKRKNPYSLTNMEDLLQSLPFPTSNINNGNLTGLTDEVLSTLFAVKPELCEQKFELKVNDVRFVGHPTLVLSRGLKEVNSSMLFNIVFALQAQASHSIVRCYYDLSKRLGIALRHEERRCGFLTDEIKIMVSTHDEIAGRCLNSLRPYHGILLLTEPLDLLESLQIDCSPALKRLIQMYNPLKSLQTLAANSDLTLAQVFQLTGHLIYWAKATIIYPLCESNVYVISSDAILTSQLLDSFSEHFPGVCLLQVINDFSLPTSISQKLNPLSQPHQQTQLVKIIIWLLKNHLLLQLHTYVRYIPMAYGRLSLDTKDQEICDTDVIEKSGSTWSLNETPKGTPTEIKEELSLTDKKDTLYDYQSEDYDIPSDDRKLLDRLCRLGYFNGGYHLEEIMYLENIRRSQLLQLLDKFRDVLITSECEDPAIALFYSQLDC